MQEIGAYEAKTHLSALLVRVQRGERFVITKHGRPIAELVPAGRSPVEETLQELRELRASLPDHPSIDAEELIETGRRL